MSNQKVESLSRRVDALEKEVPGCGALIFFMFGLVVLYLPVMVVWMDAFRFWSKQEWEGDPVRAYAHWRFPEQPANYVELPESER